MSDSQKGSTTPPQPPASKPSSEEDATTRKLEKDADEMAGQASETEKRYDTDHNIFTK